MNAIELEAMRIAILRLLDQNRTRFGLSAEALALRLELQASLKPSKEDLLDQLDYLAARMPKPLVEEAMKQISRENRAWRITEAGIAFVDSH